MKLISERILPFLASLVLGFVAIYYFAPDTFDRSGAKPDEAAFSDSAKEISEPSLSVQNERSGIDPETGVFDVWETFQTAVSNDDRDTVANLMRYPLQVYFPTDTDRSTYRMIANKKAFLRSYDKLFDDDVKQFVANTSSSDLWERSNGILTPRGEIWIDIICVGTGRNNCSTGYDTKIRTIHASSPFIPRTKIDDPATLTIPNRSID